MNERAAGKGVEFRDENGVCWELSKYYMQITVLVDETRELLQHIVSVFERACDSMGMKINVGKREGMWQVLKMYMWGKFLSGIKSMYVDISACVIMKRGESEQFRIDSGVRQGCIMSPWLFNVYMDGVMKEVKMEMGRRSVRFLEDGREGDCLASCLQMTWFYVMSGRIT